MFLFGDRRLKNDQQVAAIGQQITDNISWELFFFYFHCLSSSKMITLTSLFNSFSQDITQVALVKSNKQVPVALLKSNFTHLYLVAGLFQLTC